MEDNNKYLINLVAKDLVFIRDEWDNSISDDSLRRSSNVLRNLLVFDYYGQAWRKVGIDKQPQIEAPDLEQYLSGIPIEKIMFSQAGGADYKGVKVMAMYHASCVMRPEQIKEQYKRGPFAGTRVFWLSDYMNSPCIIISGEMISRKKLIQYVANKLGGAHLDMKRDLSKEDDRVYAMLDKYSKTIVADKNAIYYELLSVGQSLARSSDLKVYLDAVKGMTE